MAPQERDRGTMYMYGWAVFSTNLGFQLSVLCVGQRIIMGRSFNVPLHSRPAFNSQPWMAPQSITAVFPSASIGTNHAVHCNLLHVSSRSARISRYGTALLHFQPIEYAYYVCALVVRIVSGILALIMTTTKNFEQVILSDTNRTPIVQIITWLALVSATLAFLTHVAIKVYICRALRLESWFVLGSLVSMSFNSCGRPSRFLTPLRYFAPRNLLLS